jgi:hypothetical protein
MMRLLRHSIDEIEKAVVALQARFPPPEYVPKVSGFRHQQLDDLLMSFLKCVRCVSLVRAAIALLEQGFYQEVGIFCRCISESVEDVLFLSVPLGEKGTMSKAQTQLVEEFFQEEFEDPNKPVGSQPDRHRVPRNQVLAGIARIPGNPLNSSDGKLLTQMLFRGYSGYVHGAYPHIMELFGAPPTVDGKADTSKGWFAKSGRMPGQRLNEMVHTLASCTLRTAITTCIVARRTNDKGVDDRLRPTIDALSELTGSDVGDVNRAARSIKAGKPLD